MQRVRYRRWTIDDRSIVDRRSSIVKKLLGDFARVC